MIEEVVWTVPGAAGGDVSASPARDVLYQEAGPCEEE